MPRSNRAIVFGAIAVAVALGGCSEYANSERIGVTSGEAIAINRVTMMVDPWPVAAGERNIAFNGQKMQTGVERYRNNQAYAPRGMSTSGTYQPPPDQGPQNNSPVGQPVVPPAPPTK